MATPKYIAVLEFSKLIVIVKNKSETLAEDQKFFVVHIIYQSKS